MYVSPLLSIYLKYLLKKQPIGITADKPISDIEPIVSASLYVQNNKKMEQRSLL